MSQVTKRIILSRKGFDSSLGRMPSPILPTGEMLSLPIPETNVTKQHCRFRDIRFHDQTLDRIIDRLGSGRRPVPEFAHLIWIYAGNHWIDHLTGDLHTVKPFQPNPTSLAKG